MAPKRQKQMSKKALAEAKAQQEEDEEEEPTFDGGDFDERPLMDPRPKKHKVAKPDKESLLKDFSEFAKEAVWPTYVKPYQLVCGEQCKFNHANILDWQEAVSKRKNLHSSKVEWGPRELGPCAACNKFVHAAALRGHRVRG